ncbi:MAG: 4Fe-4S dicluster domain-containing protein [Candidatus Woesearchaeota archaeon]
MPKPIIDQSKHLLCKTCAQICPVTVFDYKNGKTTVARPQDCIGCRACEVSCEDEAVRLVD